MRSSIAATQSASGSSRPTQLAAEFPAGRVLATNPFERTVAERRLVFDGFDDDELAAMAAALDRIDDNVRRRLSDRPPR